MNYQLKTHCPDCFKESQQAICPHCQFNRADYVNYEAANHHLPLFTKVKKGDISYVVGRVLGEGGFAIVYTALRERDGLTFAIKEYYPEALASRGLDNCSVQPKRKESDRLNVWQKRFEQEAEHLRSCQDYPSVAGVVRFADLVMQHNTAYLVMERLCGHTLRSCLNEPKSVYWIIAWLKPLLDILAQLHGRHIFHRDISPNNVFLRAENQPVLMDFGLAREGVRDSALKSSTIGAGTEGFIAPEQAMESLSNRVDARTDLYSLGGMIYMALHGETPPSAAQRIQGAQLKRCKNDNFLVEQMEKLALHCMELDIKKRPESVMAIKKQYASLLQASEKTIIPDISQKYQNQEILQIRKKLAEEFIAKPTSSLKQWLLVVIFLAIAGYYGYMLIKQQEEQTYQNNVFVYREKKPDSSIDGYKKAIKLNPKDADAYYNWGLALYVKGDIDGAIEKYKKAIELQPKDADAYSGIGNALNAKGDYNGAIGKYQKAIALKPQDADAYHNLGITLYSQGDKDGAIEQYQKAIALNPQYAEAYHSWGLALYHNDDNEGAIEQYQKAVELNPKFADAYYDWGVVLSDQDDQDGAIEKYKKTLELNPKDADAYNNWGIVLYSKGDKDGAIEKYKKAVELNPQDADAYYNWGESLADKGDCENAKTKFEKSVALNIEAEFVGIIKEKLAKCQSITALKKIIN